MVGWDVVCADGCFELSASIPIIGISYHSPITLKVLCSCRFLDHSNPHPIKAYFFGLSAPRASQMSRKVTSQWMDKSDANRSICTQ
jgi:hypothetical protein